MINLRCARDHHKLRCDDILFNMKKLCAVFAAIMTVATVWIFCSCGTDDMRDVSERRSGYYTASDGVLTVTAVSGVRETPYQIDGKAGELKPYTLITIVPTEFDIDAVFTYSAQIGSSAYGGALNVHPFAASFSAEFDAEVSGEFKLTVHCGGKDSEFEMKSLVTPDMFGYDRAIEAAKTELKPKGKYEIRVRIIKNPLGGDGVCWHVAFYWENGRSGVLLDPVTAKVLAKKAG